MRSKQSAKRLKENYLTQMFVLLQIRFIKNRQLKVFTQGIFNEWALKIFL